MSKILVAEDNLPNRELIREILEACGHEVIEAGDGRQALDKLEENLPDLVLLHSDACLGRVCCCPRGAENSAARYFESVGADSLCNAGRPRKSVRSRLRWLSH